MNEIDEYRSRVERRHAPRRRKNDRRPRMPGLYDIEVVFFLVVLIGFALGFMFAI